VSLDVPQPYEFPRPPIWIASPFYFLQNTVSIEVEIRGDYYYYYYYSQIISVFPLHVLVTGMGRNKKGTFVDEIMICVACLAN
jgi:hypothetical protein